MIRNITLTDLDFLIEVDLESEGLTNSHTTYEKCKKKMMTFITSDHLGGLIMEDRQALLLYVIENKHKTYDWPTAYQDIPDTYFDESGLFIGVYNLWVNPSSRRRGYASQLKRALEKEAKRRHINTLYTHTEIQNQHVINMNIKLGYEIVRIGTVWDDIHRVSLIKNLYKKTAMSILENASQSPCLIDSESLKERLRSESLQILDIRLPEDSKEKYIEGSIYCHWYDVHELIKSAQLKKDIEVIVVCYTGQSSMHVATLLNLLGYKAQSLLDGMEKY